MLGLLTVLAALIGLGSWAFASPVGSSPDEDFHLPSIWCGIGERPGLCEPATSAEERRVPERLANSSACYAFENEHSAACPVDEDSWVETARGNFSGSYPPIFYGTMSVFASPNIAISTIVMRLFNAVAFVGALTAIFVMLRPGQRGPLVWGTVVTVVPLGVFIIPSVNPSSWAVLAAATLWLSLVGYFTTNRRSYRIAFGIGSAVFAVMGAGARGDSASYVAMAAFLAGVLTFEKTKSWMKLAFLPLGIILLGVFFFLTSSQTGGSLAQDGSTAPVTLGSAVRSLMLNLPLLPSLWAGSLGTWGLGWLDTTMPPAVWVTMLVLFGAATFWGLQRMNRRKAIAVLLIAMALVVVPLYAIVRDQIMVGAYLQPRYLLPMLFMFAGIALYGFERDSLGLTRLQGMVIVIGVSAANSVALYLNLRRYITGFDYRGFNLNSNIEWWWSMPLQPMALWIGGSIAFLMCLVGLLLLTADRSQHLARQ